MNILDKIVESKKREIERLRERYDPVSFESGPTLSSGLMPPFYRALANARAAGRPFFIAEFKRKSPSEGWINRDADLPAQIRSYARAGAGAISVLTDEPFFGGSYADLQQARETVQTLPFPRPLLLQKDFILDPVQIYLARRHGADIILLIAAILEPQQLDLLKKTAESLGLGVLVEVHDAVEYDKIRHLDIPVLGVNNRDLKTFRTALNRVNVLGASPVKQAQFLVAESGIRNYRDFQAVRGADAFLIGTGLMRQGEAGSSFAEFFRSSGRFLFKACGIRTPEMLEKLTGCTPANHPDQELPDFIGINFSPSSRRQADDRALQVLEPSRPGLVAVFYRNPESEILELLEKYPFHTVQVYAGDVSPAFVRRLKQRVLLAVRVGEDLNWNETFARHIAPYAADVDFFILDGPSPGSGRQIGASIPPDFPYPFLLAGGLHAGNLEDILRYERCIGVDIASGIESGGQTDPDKIRQIAGQLGRLSLSVPDFFSQRQHRYRRMQGDTEGIALVEQIGPQ